MPENPLAGALIGQCLGDALGFPVEGKPPAHCAAYVNHLREGHLLARPPFEFGQYTDDSQLARTLFESVVECGGFDAADYGRRIGALFSEDRVVGRGQATATMSALASTLPDTAWTDFQFHVNDNLHSEKTKAQA